MAGIAAVIAAIYLVVVTLCFGHCWPAGYEIAEINAIFRRRHETATSGVHFMIAVSLSVFVHVIARHGAYSFLPLHWMSTRIVALDID